MDIQHIIQQHVV